MGRRHLQIFQISNYWKKTVGPVKGYFGRYRYTRKGRERRRRGTTRKRGRRIRNHFLKANIVLSNECLTLSLLMWYIYGAPSKARNLTSCIHGRDFLLGILLLEPCISLMYAWKTNKYTNYSFSLLIMCLRTTSLYTTRPSTIFCRPFLSWASLRRH
jgi:hypothetical protein